MPDGNAEQVRLVAEKIADTAIARFEAKKQNEWPPTLKWAGMIMGGVFTALGAAGLIQTVSSVNDMQITLAELKTTLTLESRLEEQRMKEVDRRIFELEEGV